MVKTLNKYMPIENFFFLKFKLRVNNNYTNLDQFVLNP